MRTLFYLMGPTASGKTPLAVELTQRFPFEIINVDSVMIYRGMDIGSAKPDAATLKLAPHHLIDIADPADSYSAGQFREAALGLIEAIIARGNIPLLVGGTMLYFRVLQQGLAMLPRADAAYRATVQAQAYIQGWPALHAQLTAIDVVAAARIHAHDSQRISRALEVYHLTGKTISDWQQTATQPLSEYAIHAFAVAPAQRSILHARIAQRFAAMLAQGWIAEVEKLYQRGDLTADMPSMRAVGYRHIWQYLASQLSFAYMQERALAATRQLAKRQLTWLRAWPNLTWFDSEEVDLTEQVTRWIKLKLSDV